MIGQIFISSLRTLLAALFCLLASVSLEAQWTKAVGLDNDDMAQDLDEALNFQKYPTYDQYLAMMREFANDYPEICRLDTFGTSVEGRLLLALKISDQVNEDEAEASFFYSSSMHGNESVGFVLLLRMADTLLNGYGHDVELNKLVDNLQIWINPLANPDGCYSADNNLSLEHAYRTNADGFDLNRTFPNPGAGEADDSSGRPQENRYMMEFLREHHFTLSANIHAGQEVVNYPWDNTYDLHADDDWFRFISHEYADEAMAVDPTYMFGWPDGGITNGAEWYTANGTRQDYVNYYLGGREVTLELSMDYLLDSDDLEHYWNINQRPLQNYMSQCLYGIRGKVTDQETGDPLRAEISVEMHDSPYSVVYSSEPHGDFYRLIKEGVYDLVVSAPGYNNDTILDVTVTDYEASILDIQLAQMSLALDETEAPAFKIYPNPAVNTFMVEPSNTATGDLEISVHSTDGRMIMHRTVSYQGNAITFSTKQMKPGIYLVRCSSGSLTMLQRLMVIKP